MKAKTLIILGIGLSLLCCLLAIIAVITLPDDNKPDDNKG